MKIIYFFLIYLAISSCGVSEDKQPSKNTVIDKASTPISKNHVAVVDFHSKRRCATCNAIEEGVHHTMDTFFSKEVQAGKLVFRLINVDDRKNSELSEKFGAAGTSLYLNVFVDGHETIIDLTDMAFLKARNQKEYTLALKEAISKQLNKL